jgi:hypothetical protein
MSNDENHIISAITVIIVIRVPNQWLFDVLFSLC